MKNLFKLTTAALALVAFASCSNDELFGNKADIVTGDPLTIVSVEEPLEEGIIAGTRSSMDKDNNSNVVWDAKDVINVYDENLYLSDSYTYDATTNRFLGTVKDVEAPKYGIYPKANIYGTSKLDGKLTLRMDLPSTIKYTSATETKVDGKTVYASNLPLWSPATTDAKGVQMTKLRYLTAVLKVWLPNVPGNVNYLKIESNNHNLSGAFSADIDASSDAVADAVQLKDGVKGDAHQNYIFVDLTGVPSDMSVVYLPILAGTYEANDLAIYASQSTNITEANMGTAVWTKIRDFTTGVTLKRAGFYNVKVSEDSYKQQATSPVLVTKLLNNYKGQDVVKLETTTTFTMDNTTANGNTISIPAMTTTSPVVFNINGAAVTNTGTQTLLFKDASTSARFSGSIIFRNDGGTPFPVEINLPNADVVLTGANYGAVTVTAAKSLTIGDDATATTIGAISPAAGAISKSVTIAGNATVTTLNLTNVANTIKNGFELNIKGNATTVSANLAKVSMTGYTDAALGAPVAAQVGTLNSNGGDITIALPTEGEAITTALNITTDDSNLTLKQGYVKALNVSAAAAIANPKGLTVTLNSADQGLVAFAGVNKDANAKITMTESVLKGDFNSITKAATDPYGAYEYPTLKTIWTAQQLNKLNGVYASGNVTKVNITAATEIKLANSINMNDAQWWGIETSGSGLVQFNGYDVTASTKAAQTIKGIDFFKQTILDTDNAALRLNVERGFFSYTHSTGGLSVEKVNFTEVNGAFSYVWDADDATKRRTLKRFGAVVGTNTSGPVTLTDVSVSIKGDFGLSSVTNGNKANLQGADQPIIGGLIGRCDGAVTITNGQVTGAAIKGYGPVGGMVGYLAKDNNLTVTKTPTGSTFAKFTSYAVPFTSGDNADFNYVKNGAVLGSIEPAATAAAISIDNNTAANWTYSFTNPGRSYVANINGDVTNEYHFTRDGVNLIGYFGYTKAAAAKITFTIGTNAATIMGADEYATWKGAATPNYASLAKWKEAQATGTQVLYYFLKK